MVASRRVLRIYERHVKSLPREERLELLALVAQDLAAQTASMPAEPSRNIMDLCGLGKDSWEGIDAQEYVKRLHDDLASFFMTGYTIVTVSGLGDDAAAAFQKADASKGLKAGMAVLAARSGTHVVTLSTPLVPVAQNSASFATAKKLVATALSRL